MLFSGDIQCFGDIMRQESMINNKAQKIGVLWEL